MSDHLATYRPHTWAETASQQNNLPVRIQHKQLCDIFIRRRQYVLRMLKDNIRNQISRLSYNLYMGASEVRTILVQRKRLFMTLGILSILGGKAYNSVLPGFGFLERAALIPDHHRCTWFETLFACFFNTSPVFKIPSVILCFQSPLLLSFSLKTLPCKS